MTIRSCLVPHACHWETRDLQSWIHSLRCFAKCVMVLVLIIVAESLVSVQADEPDAMDRFQPPRIEISHGPGGELRNDPCEIVPEYTGYGFCETSSRENEFCASFTMGMEPLYGRVPQSPLQSGGLEYPKHDWLKQRMIERYGLRVGPLYRDDLVPVCGALYRSTQVDLKTGGDDPQGARIILDKIPRSEWPAGISLDPYAYVITPGGSLNIWNVSQTTPVKLSYDASSKTFSMKITHDAVQIYNPERNQSRSEDVVVDESSVSHWFRVGVGNEQLLFRIVSVVPPNPEQHLPGWIEIRRIWPRVTPYGAVEK